MNDPPISDECWDGLDARIRRFATPVAIVAVLALAIWSGYRASAGERLGGFGSLLVLLVVGASAAKLAAESYLFSHLGGEDSPRRRSAERMIGPLVGLARVRYVFGILGGVILPLGAQILSAGAKNIPAATSDVPTAVCAAAAAVCLLIGESAERRLFSRAMDPGVPLPKPGEETAR